jgi:DNA polymerase-1
MHTEQAAKPLGCANCPFGKTPKVGSKGPIDSRIVIVGEGPGIHEVAQKKPFVGTSGRLLDEYLKKVGFFDLGIEPYYTNATQCFPVNKEQKIMTQATHCCGPRLREELAAYPRDLIITLGTFALQGVTGNDGMRITRDRGKQLQSPYSTIGILPTYHPAFLLYNGTALPYWEKDLAFAVHLFKGGQLPPWQDPTWEEVCTREELLALIEKFEAEVQEGQTVTGDYETDSLDSFTGSILELGITWGDSNHVWIITEECHYENIDLMRRLMERKGPKWNWHNGKFDIRWSRRVGIQARVDNDTMLLSYTLNENGGLHDLDQVAYTHLGAPDHKHVLQPFLPNKKTSYRSIPPHIRRKYAADDVLKTHKLLPVLWAKVSADPECEKLYIQILIPASEVCVKIEEYGVLVDTEKVAANHQEHEAELADIDRKLNALAEPYRCGGMNFGSWQQLQVLLYDRMKLGPPGSATDADTLVKFQRNHPDNPIFNLLFKRKELAKRWGTYIKNVPPKIHKDGRIHMTLKLHGTSTGRLAGSDPNLLNQPRHKAIRDQYVAAPGKVFVEVDLNQAELRSLAIMSDDPLLVQIYTENTTSIHDITTAAFYGSKADMQEFDNVRRTAAEQLHLPEDAPWELVYAEAKMRGKAVNFGIVYGREPPSLAAEFNIALPEADRWINTWMETYKGAADFIEECRRAPVKQRNLVTVYGRKKRWGVVSHESVKGLQNEAANFPHQSTASDIMLETAIIVQPVLLERWDANIWLELYDAIYYEIDDDPTKIGESISYVQSVITQVPIARGLTKVPFLGDAKVGKRWGSMTPWEKTEQYEEYNKPRYRAHQTEQLRSNPNA